MYQYPRAQSTAAAAAAAAFQRRLFLEALRPQPTHGYADTERNSAAVSELVADPSASYAAAVLGTQLAIHAWFRSAFDARYTHQGGQDCIQPPPTSPLPLTLRRNLPSPCLPVGDIDDDADTSLLNDQISRPSSAFSQTEQIASELDED